MKRYTERDEGVPAPVERTGWRRWLRSVPEPVQEWLPELGGLQQLWQWDELAAEVGQESQARVAIAGLPQVGKRRLFNRLRGWSDAWTLAEGEITAGANGNPFHLEPFGLFVLADLAAEPNPGMAGAGVGDDLLLALGNPALIIYLLDTSAGVRPADYRWVATFRAASRPLVVALNGPAGDSGAARLLAAQAEQQLGMPVIPISAETGENVSARLLPALLDAAPRLAAPLGREIRCLRRVAARRVIRQAALFAGMMGAQPIPLLDLPFQAMIQVGMVMRLGATYGRPPSGGVSREIVGTVIGALGLRFLALSLVKVVPLLGWAVSGVVTAVSTLLLGEAAIRYYEAGGTIPLRQFVARVRPSRQWWRRARSEERQEEVLDMD